ncbi:MAG: zf-HC2 domain-containing protein [Chitinivibrionia bacterium]|nr:zf-HC2 domain-containing protein [Chitinivibrionia bacterium]
MRNSNNQCDQALERIEAYIDGELPPEDRNAFELHVGSCARCREELSYAEALAHELRALPPHRCPDHVIEEAASRAEAYAGGAGSTASGRLRARIGSYLRPWPKPVLASALIVIVAAVLIVQKHERLPIVGVPEQPAEFSPSGKELQTARTDVALAFAYVRKYSARPIENAVREHIGDRVMRTVGESILRPIVPFSFRK